MSWGVTRNSVHSAGKGDVPLVEVNIGLLADQVAVSATDTLDLGQGVHDLLFAIDLYSQSSSALMPIVSTVAIASSTGLVRHRLGFHGRDPAVRTLVLSRRKMNWKFDFSPVTSDIFAVGDVAAIS
jgi:hypothetical protein